MTINSSSALTKMTLSLITSTALALGAYADASVRKQCADEKNPCVVFNTSKGKIVLQLNGEKAPVSTKNFLQYTDEGFYDDTIFHRVIGNFVIQGGGFTKDMTQKKTNAPINNESQNGLSNARGSISMARTSAPHSATSQFYINLRDNTNLDAQPGGFGYAVFGKVIKGMDVVDAIAGVSTGSARGHRDVPTDTIVLKKVERL